LAQGGEGATEGTLNIPFPNREISRIRKTFQRKVAKPQRRNAGKNSLRPCSAIPENCSFLAKFSEASFQMTNEKFSMTNFQFRLSALVAACRAAPPLPDPKHRWTQIQSPHLCSSVTICGQFAIRNPQFPREDHELAEKKRGRRKKVVANAGASVFYLPHAKYKRATFVALRTWPGQVRRRFLIANTQNQPYARIHSY
jgi:hypothetical protein